VTVPTSAPRYADVLGVSSQEQQRLLEQAQDLAPEARWLLDRLGVRPGWRAVDLGCRPLGILDLLAQQVGPEGEVLGLDLEPQFVQLARQVVKQRVLAPACANPHEPGAGFVRHT
jgi:trans-aconitate methyltransferase